VSEWVCGLLDSVRIKFDDVNFIESDLGNDSTLKSIIGNQQMKFGFRNSRSPLEGNPTV